MTSRATLCVAVAATVLTATVRSSSPPADLTRYGKLVWNLDALVHDRYGAHACMHAVRFAIHRCRSAVFNDGEYRATFGTAEHSRFRAVARSANPLRDVNVLPITIGGRYIECATGRWLAITNAPAGWGEAVDCVTPSAPRFSQRSTPPRCRVADFSGRGMLQGATGSQLGGLVLRNNAAPCALPERPLVAIVWHGRALAIRQIRFTSFAMFGAPVRPMRTVGHGRRTFVYIQWRNWCRAVPPAAMRFRPSFRVQFADDPAVRLYRLTDAITTARCDAPSAPSTLAVSTFLVPPN